MRFRALIPLLAALTCLAFSACEKTEEKEARYLRRGNAFFEKTEWDKARIEYKNAARVAPSDAEPRYRLGLVDEAEGDMRNAFADFVAAEEQNAHYHPALLKLAQYFMAAGQAGESQKRLAIVLADAPRDPEAHALSAALLLRQKDYPTTEKEAKFALGEDPANITAVSVLTGLYSARGDTMRASQVLEDGIARNPHNLALLLLKVALYEQSSDPVRTVEAYRTILRLEPRDIRYRSGLAATYLKAGRPAEAEALWREGVADTSDDWEMKRQLVLFLDKNQGLDTAEKEIHRLMEAWPGNDEPYFWLADLYESHHAADKAVALLEAIVARKHDDTVGLGARNSLAHIEFMKGNRTLAGKLIEAVLEKDPDNRTALLIRAEIFLDEGRCQDAVSDLRTVLRDTPQDREAIHLLAEAFLLQGHTDLAIDTQSQLLDIDPADTPATVRLAQMMLMNGDVKQAKEMLALVTRTSPHYPVGWESTARVALAMHDIPTAEAAIDVLDRLDGQHLPALYLRGQALAISGREDPLPLYLQVIRADPASPLAEYALSSLIEVYKSRNRLQDAVTVIRSLHSDSPYFSTRLGELLVALQKPEEAKQALDAALAKHPAFADPYLTRAAIAVKEHQEAQALELLQAARLSAPADIRAAMTEAGVLAALGRTQDAAAVYEAILASNPDKDATANNLAQLIADHQSGDHAAMEKARQIAERFAGTSNPLYLDTLAWVYFRMGNVQQAQTLMQRVMAFNVPLPPEVHYHYGCLLLKIGRKEESKSEFRQAIAGEAEYSGKEEAKRFLNELN